MIQRISAQNGISYGKSKRMAKVPEEKTQSRVKTYTDSFVKHCADTTPVLLGLTGIWSVIDNKVGKIPLKTSFLNNLKNFFVPVLLMSSCILSAFENKNDAKKS